MSVVTTSFRVLAWDDPAERADWLSRWQAWPAREVFAHPDYVALFASASQRPCCAVWEDERGRVLYPFLLRDLAAEPYWSAAFGPATDTVTPYGYGGAWFWDAPCPETLAQDFWQAFDRWAEEQGVVSEFARLCLFPERTLRCPATVRTDRDNVVRDLRPDEDALWMDFKHKVRKNVKRAQRSGVEVEIDLAGNRREAFQQIYGHTMQRRNASEGYRFSPEFFDQLHRGLAGQLAYFHAWHNGRVVSTELVLISADTVYSFLGGTDEQAFALRPNDLLKYQIIRWAKGAGKRWFVLGGGYRPDDGIFHYKAAFAPRGVVPFRVASRVHRRELYRQLCWARAESAARKGTVWQPGDQFFPAYRAA